MNNIFYFFIYQFSRLPLSILYILSDFLFFLLYRVIGYRRGVIKTNLKKSFPEKSDEEIKVIYKKFYANFCDYLIETLKTFSISQEELDERLTFSNLEVFEEIRSEKRSAMMMCGHNFNWEWYIGMAKYINTNSSVAVYHKIRNPFWNDKINAMRARFGTKAVDMKDVLRFMMKAPSTEDITYLFVADQSPKKSAVHYFINFLNQRTPVFNGFDKIAIRKDMAVVYCKTEKIKRGYYHTTYIRIKPEEEKFKENEIVHQFFHLLEETIKEHPDNWLWSHKRWKYSDL